MPLQAEVDSAGLPALNGAAPWPGQAGPPAALASRGGKKARPPWLAAAQAARGAQSPSGGATRSNLKRLRLPVVGASLSGPSHRAARRRGPRSARSGCHEPRRATRRSASGTCVCRYGLRRCGKNRAQDSPNSKPVRALSVLQHKSEADRSESHPTSHSIDLGTYTQSRCQYTPDSLTLSASACTIRPQPPHIPFTHCSW